MADAFHPGMKILFQHHPSTGGAELITGLKTLYGDSFKSCNGTFAECQVMLHAALDPNATPQMITAHSGLLGPPGPHVAVLTFFRDPVERFLSEAFYRARMDVEEGRPASKIPPDRKQRAVHNVADSNRYLRWACKLAGVEVEANTLVTGKVLTVAREVVARGYLMVGITKRFEESLRLMASILNWPEVPKTTRPAGFNSGRPNTADLDPDIVEWAQEATRYDQALYEVAVARFDREWTAFTATQKTGT